MLSTGQVVPEGTIIDVPTWSLHRSPDLWPQPDHFNPDRFLGPAALDAERSLAWQPFGWRGMNEYGQSVFSSLQFRYQKVNAERVTPLS